MAAATARTLLFSRGAGVAVQMIAIAASAARPTRPADAIAAAQIRIAGASAAIR